MPKRHRNPVEHRPDGSYWAVLPRRFSVHGAQWWLGPFRSVDAAAEVAGLVHAGAGARVQAINTSDGYYVHVAGGLRLSGSPAIGPFDRQASAAGVLGRLQPGDWTPHLAPTKGGGRTEAAFRAQAMQQAQAQAKATRERSKGKAGLAFFGPGPAHSTSSISAEAANDAHLQHLMDHPEDATEDEEELLERMFPTSKANPIGPMPHKKLIAPMPGVQAKLDELRNEVMRQSELWGPRSMDAGNAAYLYQNTCRHCGHARGYHMARSGGSQYSRKDGCALCACKGFYVPLPLPTIKELEGMGMRTPTPAELAARENPSPHNALLVRVPHMDSEGALSRLYEFTDADGTPRLAGRVFWRESDGLPELIDASLLQGFVSHKPVSRIRRNRVHRRPPGPVDFAPDAALRLPVERKQRQAAAALPAGAVAGIIPATNIARVPLDAIRLNRAHQPREGWFVEPNVGRMVATFDMDPEQFWQLFDPIDVRPIGSGEYELIHGHNRYEAAKRIRRHAGETGQPDPFAAGIPAKIMNVDAKRARQIADAANLSGQPLTPGEIAPLLKRWLNDGSDEDEILRQMPGLRQNGVRKSDIRLYAAVADLPKSMLEALNNPALANRYTLAHAMEFARAEQRYGLRPDELEAMFRKLFISDPKEVTPASLRKTLEVVGGHMGAAAGGGDSGGGQFDMFGGADQSQFMTAFSNLAATQAELEKKKRQIALFKGQAARTDIPSLRDPETRRRLVAEAETEIRALEDESAKLKRQLWGGIAANPTVHHERVERNHWAAEWTEVDGVTVLRVPGSRWVAVPTTGRQNARRFDTVNLQHRTEGPQLLAAEVRHWLARTAEAEGVAPTSSEQHDVTWETPTREERRDMAERMRRITEADHARNRGAHRPHRPAQGRLLNPLANYWVVMAHGVHDRRTKPLYLAMHRTGRHAARYLTPDAGWSDVLRFTSEREADHAAAEANAIVAHRLPATESERYDLHKARTAFAATPLPMASTSPTYIGAAHSTTQQGALFNPARRGAKPGPVQMGFDTAGNIAPVQQSWDVFAAVPTRQKAAPAQQSLWLDVEPHELTPEEELLVNKQKLPPQLGQARFANPIGGLTPAASAIIENLPSPNSLMYQRPGGVGPTDHTGVSPVAVGLLVRKGYAYRSMKDHGPKYQPTFEGWRLTPEGVVLWRLAHGQPGLARVKNPTRRERCPNRRCGKHFEVPANMRRGYCPHCNAKVAVV